MHTTIQFLNEESNKTYIHIITKSQPYCLIRTFGLGCGNPFIPRKRKTQDHSHASSQSQEETAAAEIFKLR